MECSDMLEGHQGPVVCVKSYKDWLIAGSNDKTVRIWCTRTGRCLHVLTGHDRPITCLVVENHYLYSCSFETIKKWDLNTMTEVKHFISSAKFLDVKDGLIYVATSTLLRVMNTEDESIIMHMKGHTSLIRCVKVLEAFPYVLTGSNDTTIRVWNLKTGELIRILDKHLRSVITLAESKANKLVYSGSLDCTIRLWDMTTFECIMVLSDHKRDVTGITVVDDLIYSCSLDRNVRIWNHQGKCLQYISVPNVELSCIVANGNLLYAGNKTDSKILVWNRQPVNVMRTWKVSADYLKLSITYDKVYTLCSDRTVRIYNRTRGQLLQNVQLESTSSPTAMLVGDHRIYIGFDNGKIQELEEVQEPVLTHQFVGHTDAVTSLASFNQKLISGSKDWSIRIWDRKTYECLRVLRGHTNTVTGLQVCSNLYRKANEPKNYMYSCSKDQTIQIWNLKTGESIFKSDSTPEVKNPMECMIVSRNYLYAANTNIHIWNLETKSVVGMLQGHDRSVTQLAATEKYLYSASTDQTIRIWNREKKECVQVLCGHTFFVNGLANVDDAMLYSCSNDKKIIAWNLKLLEASKFNLMNVHSVLWLKQYISDHPHVSLQYILHLVSFLGIFNSALFLIQTYQLEISQEDINGECGLYFALLNKQFTFLKLLAKQFKEERPGQLNMRSLKGKQLLMKKMQEDDLPFLMNVMNSGLAFPMVDVLSYSFLNSNALGCLSYYLKTSYINMLNTEGRTILHMAVFYGCPKAVALILETPGVAINMKDKQGSTALHLAFQNTDTLSGLRGMRTSQQVLLDRYECAKIIIVATGHVAKPDLLTPDNEGMSSYDKAVLEYDQCRKNLRTPYHENEARIRLAKLETCFASCCEIIDTLKIDRKVSRYRHRFALNLFLKRVIPYLLWLVFLLIVAFGRTSRSNATGYYFASNVQNTFDASTFNKINTHADLWNWFDNAYIKGLNTSVDGNILVGAGIFRQLRVQLDTCRIIPYFSPEVKQCQNYVFIEDKTSFGPNGKYEWKPYTTGEVHFLSKLGQDYHSGGFVEIIPSDFSIAKNISTTLQQDRWLNTSTRIVIAGATVYNPNLNLFSVIRFVVEFSGSGAATTSIKQYTVQIIRYFYHYDYFLLFLELLIILYFCVEFILQEVYEAVKTKKRYLRIFSNYFEGLIIGMFLSVFCLRLASIHLVSKIPDLTTNEFVGIAYIAQIVAIDDEITAWLIFCAFLRTIKFLRIPPFCGPAALSMLDTLKERSFLVFVCIFVFVILSFGFTFQISFANSTFELRDLGHSVMTTVRMFFGELVNQNDLENGSEIFGPILLMLFLFGAGLILSNMFIAVISDGYINLHKHNTSRWELRVTGFMVKELKCRKFYKKMTSFDTVVNVLKICSQRLRSKFGTPDMDTAAHATITSDTAASLVKPYSDSKLDDMVLKYESERSGKNNKSLTDIVLSLHKDTQELKSQLKELQRLVQQHKM